MSLAAATLAATSAAADETGPPVAITPLEWGSEDTTSILVYGQIDKGVLSFDDGENSTSYGLTDNANSSTRAGVTSRTRLSDEWELFSNIEIQYAPHSSGTVNQLDPNAADYGFDNGDIRKIEAALFSDRYGRFWIGQGSMASDGVAEVDLSGTGVIAYSSVGDTAGGSLFAFRGGGLSDVTVGDVFDNFDGLGRKVRVRYDTPDFSGFRLRTSYGRNLLADDDAGLYDVAVTYDGAFGAFLVAAAAGYARDEGNGADILSGSVSGLHEPTGLSLTFAAGGRDSSGSDPSYVYSKLGWQTSFFDFGSTSFSVDYYTGDSIGAGGSSSESWAVAAVQTIDYWRSEIWLTLRDYAYDDDAADFRDGRALFGGLRIRF